MRILGIDTALGACSAALLEGDQIVSHAHESMQRGHAEALAPMVDAVMRGSGLSFSNLERIAVTTGPGTFTGQRVGLAFTRALALALKIPIVGVTTLDAMATQALSEEGTEWVVVASDAKRGELYLGARSSNGETLIEASILGHDDAARRVLESLETFGSKLALAGTGAELLRSLLGKDGKFFRPAKVQQPDAVYVARLGMDMPVPDAPPRPLYLRAPDAKLPKQAAL